MIDLQVGLIDCFQIYHVNRGNICITAACKPNAKTKKIETQKGRFSFILFSELKCQLNLRTPILGRKRDFVPNFFSLRDMFIMKNPIVWTGTCS